MGSPECNRRQNQQLRISPGMNGNTVEPGTKVMVFSPFEDEVREEFLVIERRRQRDTFTGNGSQRNAAA